MKYTVRSFSVGLLTSGIILLIAFYFIGDSAQSVEDLDPEAMIPALENKGYTVLTKEEYISLTVQNGEEATAETEDQAAAESESEEQQTSNSEEEIEEESADEEASEQEETEESASANEQETEERSSSYTLTINEGMASSDISSLLAGQNIVEDASEFNSYLNEHEYSDYIQIGTFELSSDMSFYEIAERIAN